MHFCKAKIALGSDSRNVFHAGEFSPISWPEVLILQAIHGDSAVDEVEPFVSVEQSPKDERDRLAEKYTEDVVDAVFGGKQGRPQEMEAPGVRIRPGVMWHNPLSQAVETTTAPVTGEKK